MPAPRRTKRATPAVAMGSASSQVAEPPADLAGEEREQNLHEDDLAASSQIIQESQQERSERKKQRKKGSRKKRTSDAEAAAAVQETQDEPAATQENGDGEVGSSAPAAAEVDDGVKKGKAKKRKTRQNNVEVVQETPQEQVTEENGQEEIEESPEPAEEAASQPNQSKKRKRRSKDVAQVEVSPVEDVAMEDADEAPAESPVIHETPQMEEQPLPSSMVQDDSVIPSSQPSAKSASRKLKKIKKTPRPSTEQPFQGYIPDSLTDPALLKLSAPQDSLPSGELEVEAEPAEAAAAKPKKRKRRSEVEETQEGPDATAGEKPKKRKSKQQKAQEAEGADGENHTQAGEDERPVTATNNFRTAGAFTQPEINRLGRAIESFRDYNSLSQSDVNEMIQDTETKDAKTAELWAEILASLPNRTRQSVYRFCRRRWHNYEKRGKWTEDEDEALKEAYKAKPDKWKDIGRMIGRMPDDARDRWRNYLKCGDNMRKDVWSDDEIHALLSNVSANLDKLVGQFPDADQQFWREHLGLRHEGRSWTNSEIRVFMQLVPDCLDALRDFHKTPNPSLPDKEREAIGEQIDWNRVSEQMGGRRSRLQCLMKWKALANRFGGPAKPKEAKFDSWRFKSGNSAYDKMLPGDKYEIVRQVSEMGIADEERISWRAVCHRFPDDAWQSHHRKVALLRMKKLVPEQPDFVTLLAELRAYFERKYPEELGKRFERKKKEKKSREAPKRKKDTENVLSKEVVDEEDDGDAAGAAASAESGEAGAEEGMKREDSPVDGSPESPGSEVDSLLGARDDMDMQE